MEHKNDGGEFDHAHSDRGGQFDAAGAAALPAGPAGL